MKRIAYLLTIGLCASCLGIAPAGQGEAIAPVNLENVNTAADEDDPFDGPGGMALYYATKVDGAYSIWASRRKSVKAAWPAGKVVPQFSAKDADFRSPFQHKTTFYYACNEVPDPSLAKLKNFDVYQKTGIQAATVVLGISEKTDEMHPWVTPAGKEFYFSRKTAAGWMLYMAKGPNPGPIGAAKPVGFPKGFHHATLTKDTLHMYLQGPVDNGGWGLFRSKRTKVGSAWSVPEPLTAVNNPKGLRGDMSPSISADGTRLYFASDRPGGKGGLDLWYVLTSQLK